ncbi:hypothetical protein Lalb_Chr01g0011151 [Lupinus albus]|uniref:Uncharacterized protein n=1 Tax=Lupinus albus TaxID=3870 RepID=A0A6A4R6Q7_LUPAL|nr:hypothetical protein Lalb_Chr01g0011151 [Lupinus albus]
MYEAQENNIELRTTTVSFSYCCYLANHAQLTWFSDGVEKNAPIAKILLEPS